MEQQMEKKNYYNLGVEACYEEFGSGEDGLSPEAAASRLADAGPNKIASGKKKSLLAIFASQFRDFMIWILIAAGAISGFLGEWVDAGIILFVVALNSILGTIQESRAEAALEALKNMAVPFALVIRGGQTVRVLSQDLVPGDLVVLTAGDSVPADLRLTKSASLRIDESALTGESIPGEKTIKTLEGDLVIGDHENMAYMNTNVTYGRGQGLVVATGMNTEMGSIARGLTDTEKESTPLQLKLNQISNLLSIGVLTIAGVIFAIGMLSGGELLDMFLTAVSLAVAAIPEGMVAVITIVLALGMSKLAKKGAIIRKLPAVETLGSTQVICSDKTGTLTQNKMTVVQLVTENDELLREALLACNDSVVGADGKLVGDPTETALLDYLLNKDQITLTDIDQRIRAGEIPFDSERKKSTVVVKIEDNHYRVFVKGALDGMLDTFVLSEEDKDSLRKENEEMAVRALRVLAFGYRDLEEYEGSSDLELEEELHYLGLVGMIDPPRPEALEAIRICREASILPVMITGDHKDTAVAIARDLKMLEDGRTAITGIELEKMDDREFESRIETIGVYARVAPEDKTRIVRMWQSKGRIVAMTGDGVNDAPALKAADIGVGMGITGTEVSKGASDMVLTDDNFATIVTAIREGRRIFDNIHKTISFLLSSNAGEVLAILTATILGWKLLSPIHILWINLVTDTFPALALGVEPGERNIMSRPPRDGRKPLLGRKEWLSIGFMGAAEALLTLGAFLAGVTLYQDTAVATTMAFVTLAASQLFASLGFQSLTSSIFLIRPRKHPALWLSFAGSLALQLLVVLVPPLNKLFGLAQLDGVQWMIVTVLSFGMLLIIEAFKFLGKRRG